MTKLVESKRSDLNRICRQYHVSRLDLFGSATTDSFDPRRSDLDFVVVFKATTPELHAERYFGLLSSMEDLFGCHIDLVEAGAIRNPYFRQGVESSRVNVYAA
jgi:predicted nucleotidyltransferase